MRITRHPLLPPTGGLRAIPADEAIINRLEASFAAAVEDGSLAPRFFQRLLADDPALARLFPDDQGARARALTTALAGIVVALRRPQGLHEGAGGHGQRDLTRRADPLANAAVSHHVVAALADVLGDRWNAELDHDWTRTLEIVASLRSQAS